MRSVTRLFILAGALAALAAGAVAASAAAPRTTIKVTPRVVAFGEDQHVTGRNWAVIEFCERHVRVRLRSAQNGLLLGTAHIRRSGRFSFEWTPRRAKVGAGRWRLVVLQRCESGQDGSFHFTRRSRRIRIIAHQPLHP